jgi:hypothetical protein
MEEQTPVAGARGGIDKNLSGFQVDAATRFFPGENAQDCAVDGNGSLVGVGADMMGCLRRGQMKVIEGCAESAEKKGQQPGKPWLEPVTDQPQKAKNQHQWRQNRPGREKRGEQQSARKTRKQKRQAHDGVDRTILLSVSV